MKLNDTEKEILQPDILPDTEYARLINFYAAPDVYEDSFNFPIVTESIEFSLYRVLDEQFDPNNDPISYESFTPKL